MSIEKKYLAIIKGERSGFFSSLIKTLALPLSWAYRVSVYLRNKGYDLGYLKQQMPEGPLVVSIGNIVAGGTGKTPATLMIAQTLLEDIPVAILSRGYRSEAERAPDSFVLSHGNGPEYPVNMCGDEAYILARRLIGAYVVVGKNRCRSAEIATEMGAHLLIIDDGMQHRRLARHYEIVVMDASDPFGQGYHLPRGLLRETPHALRRADLIILNGVHSRHQLTIIKDKIRHYTTTPIVQTRMVIEKIVNNVGVEYGELKGKTVGLLCGIGNPDSFIHTVKEAGADIADQLIVGDHRAIGQNRLVQFADRCYGKGAEFLVCTEKDFVKLPSLKNLTLPVVCVQAKLEIVGGEEEWRTFMTIIKSNFGHLPVGADSLSR